RKGLVAAVANFLLQEYDANILNADQHQDPELGLFFMRVEFSTEKADCHAAQFQRAFGPIAEQLRMNWQLHFADSRENVAIFVSKYLHCLADLLYRHQNGEFRSHLSMIVSNHENAEALAEFYQVPFHYLPTHTGMREQVEEQQLKLLADNNVDLVVLARYMQVLSPKFVAAYPQKIINVHHSFLPAFTGAKPYHAAFARGVKLIGATSHYVTEVLDDGPIIEQDVARVSQNDQLPGLIQKGRDLERMVLSRAVQWHLARRILCYANKTVIFA
ncbi:MAG TPA: formyltetrahydrofolate deformylase, partial [Acidobacteriaceae bacterium]|nr:formyltetrahydrofolate deformylase [Acidobacteriaceae bacterium]